MLFSCPVLGRMFLQGSLAKNIDTKHNRIFSKMCHYTGTFRPTAADSAVQRELSRTRVFQSPETGKCLLCIIPYRKGHLSTMKPF